MTASVSPSSTDLARALQARGVVLHHPESCILQDLDPGRIAPGVTIFPGTHLSGRHTLLGAGTVLGRGGGGTFHNVRTGRGVDLYGGFFSECVFLDGVTLRGHAEVREGTLLEEGCEGAHHVGYKMTLQLPWTVAGSLINCCDVLMAGGTSREDHSEIGSCLALYNYTPSGDKFASRFGDVPRGVFCHEPRVFLGGQTRIVSPVRVGFGTVIAAGSALRRDVPDGRLVSDPDPHLDQAWDPRRIGRITPRVDATLDFLGQVRALQAWYAAVRTAWAGICPWRQGLVEGAQAMLALHIAEREKRLARFMEKIPDSLAGWEEDGAATRIEEHRRWLATWPDLKTALHHRLQQPPALAWTPPTPPGDDFPAWARSLKASRREEGTAALQALVDELTTLPSALHTQSDRAPGPTH
jgi:UDP-N-acetylglucosamine/UDP-N-acetylgalactosamine diphosphorylase